MSTPRPPTPTGGCGGRRQVAATWTYSSAGRGLAERAGRRLSRFWPGTWSDGTAPSQSPPGVPAAAPTHEPPPAPSDPEQPRRPRCSARPRARARARQWWDQGSRVGGGSAPTGTSTSHDRRGPAASGASEGRPRESSRRRARRRDRDGVVQRHRRDEKSGSSDAPERRPRRRPRSPPSPRRRRAAAARPTSGPDLADAARRRSSGGRPAHLGRAGSLRSPAPLRRCRGVALLRGRRTVAAWAWCASGPALADRGGRRTAAAAPACPARDLHPVAWWVWAIGLAAAASSTTNPLVLLLIVGVADRGGAAAALRPALGARRSALYVWLAVAWSSCGCSSGSCSAAEGRWCSRPPRDPAPGLGARHPTARPVTREALLAGLYDGLRLGAIVVCSRRCQRAGQPQATAPLGAAALYEIGTALVVAVTVLPQFAESLLRVRRGPAACAADRTGRVGLRRIVVPVLEDALDRSLALAAGMDTRGYGRSAGATPRQRRLDRRPDPRAWSASASGSTPSSTAPPRAARRADAVVAAAIAVAAWPAPGAGQPQPLPSGPWRAAEVGWRPRASPWRCCCVDGGHRPAVAYPPARRAGRHHDGLAAVLVALAPGAARPAAARSPSARAPRCPSRRRGVPP